MALKKIVNINGKLVLQSSIGNFDKGAQQLSFLAYIKVITVNGSKSQVFANVNFKGDEYEYSREYEIPVSVSDGSANFIRQAYDHLKTLEEFAGAIDC
jgi:hypothetical protein